MIGYKGEKSFFPDKSQSIKIKAVPYILDVGLP